MKQIDIEEILDKADINKDEQYKKMIRLLDECKIYLQLFHQIKPKCFHIISLISQIDEIIKSNERV